MRTVLHLTLLAIICAGGVFNAGCATIGAIARDAAAAAARETWEAAKPALEEAGKKAAEVAQQKGREALAEAAQLAKDVAKDAVGSAEGALKRQVDQLLEEAHLAAARRAAEAQARIDARSCASARDCGRCGQQRGERRDRPAEARDLRTPRDDWRGRDRDGDRRAPEEDPRRAERSPPLLARPVVCSRGLWVGVPVGPSHTKSLAGPA